MPEKEKINIAFIGHVDHGKSTLVGHLFFKFGAIDERKMNRLERQASQTKKKGKFKFAFVMDDTKEERERGLTIQVTYKRFETKNYIFNIKDAPGHQDFVRNMISGAGDADVAVLVVDAKDRDEKGNLMPQTKEHLILISSLGVDKIIVALNKMDATQPSYDKEMYETTKTMIETFVEQIGIKVDLVFIPISAYYAENLTNKSEKMKWYTGKTFIEILNDLDPPKRQRADGPLRMPLLRTFGSPQGAILAGTIESGQLKLEDEIIVVPYPTLGSLKGKVKDIEFQHQKLTHAGQGDDVGLLFKSSTHFERRKIHKGAMIGSRDKPPKEVSEFIGKVVLYDHPKGMRAGYSPTLHCHQAVVPCVITEIINSFDANTGEIISNSPDYVKNGQGATVRIKSLKPLVIEEVKNFPRLGRFAIRDMNLTVGVGMCIEVSTTRGE